MGINGDCFITVTDLEALFGRWIEVCVPVIRSRAPPPDPKAMATSVA